MKIANFEKRVISYLIDLGISLGFSFLLYYFALINIDFIKKLNSFVIISLCSSLIYFILNSIITYVSNGYTIGNLFARIKIISEDQNRIHFKNTSLKYCFMCFPICIFVNAIYMLIVHSQKTIFDILSNTISISTKKEF